MEKEIIVSEREFDGGTPFTSKLIDNSDEVGKKIVDSLKLSSSP